MYLVDAADPERFPESARELNGLLSDDGLASVPFLILGNKIDLPYAASEDQLRHQLGLAQYTTGKPTRPDHGKDLQGLLSDACPFLLSFFSSSFATLHFHTAVIQK